MRRRLARIESLVVKKHGSRILRTGFIIQKFPDLAALLDLHGGDIDRGPPSFELKPPARRVVEHDGDEIFTTPRRMDQRGQSVARDDDLFRKPALTRPNGI